MPDVRRRLGISQQTYCRWRTKFGGTDPKMARQLQELHKKFRKENIGAVPGD